MICRFATVRRLAVLVVAGVLLAGCGEEKKPNTLPLPTGNYFAAEGEKDGRRAAAPPGVEMMFDFYTTSKVRMGFGQPGESPVLTEGTYQMSGDVVDVRLVNGKQVSLAVAKDDSLTMVAGDSKIIFRHPTNK